MRRGFAVLAGFLVLLWSPMPALAEGGGPIQRQIDELFWAITWFALLVAVIVFGALFWFMIRYRRSVSPEPLHIEGNKRLELVWTVFPTVILVLITAISIPVLLYTDTPPPADTTVTIIGQRFSWKFEYEDGMNTSAEMWIQEDVVVRFRVTSIDVIHSFAVPQLGIKLDAIPGRYNTGWFIADTPGDYLNQCAEFCGDGHWGMRAVIHVFPAGSQPKIYGPPPVSIPFMNVELREFGGNGSAPWSIAPSVIEAVPLDVLRLKVWNNNSIAYTFQVDSPIDQNVTVPSTGFAWLNFTPPEVIVDTNVTYGPTNATARSQGMVGTLVIYAAIVIELHDSPYFVRPNPLVVPLNEPVRFLLKNTGTLDHNFTMDAFPNVRYDPLIPPGGSVVIGPFVFSSDESGQYWCNVIGHRQAGMVANFRVGAGGTNGAATTSVPVFEMIALTIFIGGIATFAYVVHHARRQDET
ncbi:MAG TPA: cytochrome c oxidase subunit II [Thermoplasmata archaeon]|nr:cytochrome c oxidase subunit II [Thermoplasmata archaeon]